MSADKSMPSSIVDAQVQRLLEIVTEYQQQQCSALQEKAHLQSRKIIRQAYRNARLRLHHDIQDSRQNMQQELSATKAKQHTFLMQQRHRQDQQFLDKTWELLSEKLQQRWLNPQHKQVWVQNIISTALQVLPGKKWQVLHPSDWSVEEQKNFSKSVVEVTAREISFMVAEEITAGIRIVADSALVDGTIQGLLVDRSRIESEILAQRREYLAGNRG